MSKLFNATQIKEWDNYTIIHEPIASIDLMERAVSVCCEWILDKFPVEQHFTIFCGSGNNGGDGLALARMLIQNKYEVRVIISEKKNRSNDNSKNFDRLHSLNPEVISIFNDEISLPKNTVIIDAILGTGLQSAAKGYELIMIRWINAQHHEVISIDLPSGLSADTYLPNTVFVKANITLSFQQYKKCFLFLETAQTCGEIIILDIGLSKYFENKESSIEFILDHGEVKKLYKPRYKFSHKGNFGHALLVNGSKGMMGAAILSAKACLRSGSGLLSLLIAEDERFIIQNAAPEAMCIFRENNSYQIDITKYNAIGIGCGLGNSQEAKDLLNAIIYNYQKPLVLDADALNIISSNPELKAQIPKGSVITPHPKEFDRLFGLSTNTFERHEKQKLMSKQLGIYIILKGRYTSLTNPNGETYFNTNGNPGMATGGSGDVLTGIITGLYAQYQEMQTACLMGIYLHGLAGDLAAEFQSQEALIASDLIEYLGSAFKHLHDNA